MKKEAFITLAIIIIGGYLLPKLVLTPQAESYYGEESVFALKIHEVIKDEIKKYPMNNLLITGYSISSISRDKSTDSSKRCTIRFDYDASKFTLWWDHTATVSIRSLFGIPIKRIQYTCSSMP